MIVEFLDETTVIITEEFQWTGVRPPPDQRCQMTKLDILEKFKDMYPNYDVNVLEGTGRVSNWRGLRETKGKWTLKVSKKLKRRSPPNKKNKLKSSKQASKVFKEE